MSKSDTTQLSLQVRQLRCCGSDGRRTRGKSIVTDYATKYKYFLNRRVMAQSAGAVSHINPVLAALHENLLKQTADGNKPLSLLQAAHDMQQSFPNANDCDFILSDAVDMSMTGCVVMIGRHGSGRGFNVYCNSRLVPTTSHGMACIAGIGSGSTLAIEKATRKVKGKGSFDEEHLKKLMIDTFSFAFKDKMSGGHIVVNTTALGMWKEYIHS